MTKPEGYRGPRVQANPDVNIELFREYLPQNTEQCLRLVLGQLYFGLRKSSLQPLLPAEIEQLATAAHALYSIYAELQAERQAAD